MSVRPRTTNIQSRCPGSLEGTAYVQRVQQYIENKQDIKPKDRIAFKVLVRHFVHNRDRKLVDAALDLIIPEGFSCFSYNPADYTDLVSSSPEPCCSKAKLFIEFVYFFRKFHEKSSANATRRRELTILSSIILLSRDITEEELLKFADTSAEEIASITEYQQIKPIDEAISMGDSLKIERLGNLKYFRRAQEIRDAHGVARSPRLVQCFQSMSDIDEMVKQLKEQNPVEFLVQAYALGLIEPRLLRKMYHTPKDYTQLVALLDRTAVVRSYYESRSTNEDHTRMFITAFRQLSRLRATWTQTLLLFLLGINVPVGWYLPRMDLETIPNDHLHIFLNYLLTYSYKSLIKPEHGIQDLDLMENLSRLPSMVRRLLEREASPYYVTHSHDAVKQLLKNDCPSLQVAGAYIEKRCPMYSSLGVILRLPRNWQQLSFVGMMPDFCCPVRRDDTTIVFDNTRIASLSCLAARSYKLDRELSELPAKLHGMILFHQDLKRLIKPGTTWLEFLAQNSPTHSRQ